MNRVGTLTVIRGNGGVEAFMNGVINAELKRQREEFEKEMDYANMIKNRRNDLLKEKCDELHAQTCQRSNRRIRHKARETFEFILACIFAWGEALGIIEYVYNNNNKKGEWK